MISQIFNSASFFELHKICFLDSWNMSAAPVIEFHPHRKYAGARAAHLCRCLSESESTARNRKYQNNLCRSSAFACSLNNQNCIVHHMCMQRKSRTRYTVLYLGHLFLRSSFRCLILHTTSSDTAAIPASSLRAKGRLCPRHILQSAFHNDFQSVELHCGKTCSCAALGPIIDPARNCAVRNSLCKALKRYPQESES